MPYVDLEYTFERCFFGELSNGKTNFVVFILFILSEPSDADSFLFVQSVGIAVEFCSHILHSFVRSKKKTATERAEDSLANMGISVSQKKQSHLTEFTSFLNFRGHHLIF